ncbi:FkbM family methyltransferase [Spongorhabdus nitratireducens]
MSENRTVHINDKTFTVSRGCADWVWDAWQQGDWQKDTLNVFDRFIHPDKAVIDMGAWIGPLSLYAATRTRGEIHSIEPDQTSYTELTHNFSLNPEYSNRLFAHPVAIGPENKTATLYGRRNFGDSASSLLSRTKDRGLEQSVQVQTLEAFLKQNNISDIGFLKIDIEGGEFALLPQIRNWLAEHTPTLHLSLHTPFLREAYFRQYSNQWLGKHLNKLESKSGISLLSNRFVNPKLTALLSSLACYRFIYSEEGHEVSLNNLHPNRLCKDTIDLVFTNEKW